MQLVFEKYSVIVGFLIMCIMVQTLMGNEVLNDMLLLILLSIVILNADSFVKMIGGNEV